MVETPNDVPHSIMLFEPFNNASMYLESMGMSADGCRDLGKSPLTTVHISLCRGIVADRYNVYFGRVSTINLALTVVGTDESQ